MPEPQLGPQLDIKLLDDGLVQICWPEPPLGYFLQSTFQLVPSRWVTMEDQGRVSNGRRCVVLKAGEKQTFFRLIVSDTVGAY